MNIKFNAVTQIKFGFKSSLLYPSALALGSEGLLCGGPGPTSKMVSDPCCVHGRCHFNSREDFRMMIGPRRLLYVMDPVLHTQRSFHGELRHFHPYCVVFALRMQF